MLVIVEFRFLHKHLKAACFPEESLTISQIHPLHLSSLHFLRALAEESAGRLQPLLSAQRLSRLQRAKADYEDAISVLDQDVLLSLFPSTPRPELSKIQRPKPLLSRVCASALSDLSDVDEEENPFVDSGLPLEQLKAEIRLRETLRDFQERLTWHRERVWACTDEMMMAPEARQRRLSSRPGNEEKREDVQARIARGKREGWKRVRFDPERVQDLCHLALAEL